MTSLPMLAKRILVSACALTHTTERAARVLGTAAFLPALFADRFTHLGGMPEAEFRAQLAGCRSFEDERWAGYWRDFALPHRERADAALARLGGPSTGELLDPAGAVDVEGLGKLLAPAVTILADRGPVANPDAVQRFCAEHPDAADAANALDGLIKVLVYEFVAAWPGWSPRRLEAYERSHRLTEILLTALASAMEVTVESMRIPFGDGDAVRGFLILPQGVETVPLVLVTNGLEGSLAEATLPLLAHRHAGLGLFVMEMPGTYSYREPLSPAAERVYSTVLDVLSADPRVDADRIGMLGFSFGAYWTTRMAAVEKRLRVAVANGAPAHRSFGPGGSLGVPEVIVSTLRHATGATGTTDLMRRLRGMSLRDHYRRIEIPILVINGANDTLISTQDSIDIAVGAPDAQLVLYADDDHCAMGHAVQWSELSVRFLREHLLPAGTPEPLTR
ncbi:alpha/beta hydrolase family protein [Nocardia sp. NPDC059240]|uniref:alpha/beta hydrolase family protein n=1 Tax=Nocardia sp. NPDC059240 TaxID=3346786 RepID=UPI0036A5BF99